MAWTSVVKDMKRMISNVCFQENHSRLKIIWSLSEHKYCGGTSIPRTLYWKKTIVSDIIIAQINGWIKEVSGKTFFFCSVVILFAQLKAKESCYSSMLMFHFDKICSNNKHPTHSFHRLWLIKSWPRASACSLR